MDGPTNRNPKKAMFVLDKPAAIPAGSKLTIRLVHDAIDEMVAEAAKALG